MRIYRTIYNANNILCDISRLLMHNVNKIFLTVWSSQKNIYNDNNLSINHFYGVKLNKLLDRRMVQRY